MRLQHLTRNPRREQGGGSIDSVLAAIEGNTSNLTHVKDYFNGLSSSLEFSSGKAFEDFPELVLAMQHLTRNPRREQGGGSIDSVLAAIEGNTSNLTHVKDYFNGLSSSLEFSSGKAFEDFPELVLAMHTNVQV